MFFSFEGIDGSGKSTQAKLLAGALRERGYSTVEVREPGGTELGERVRALLLDTSASIVDRAELLLFSAARAQLVDQVIRPALAEGAVVIADRYIDSSTAYQGGGREIGDSEWMASLHHFATAGTLPNRTYLIDTTLGEAASRRGARPLDRMERSEDSFYRRIRQTYLSQASTLERMIVLDGSGTVDQIHQAIVADALSVLEREA